MNLSLKSRPATEADLPRLAELNAHLIEDEGHRNPMSRKELEERMRNWLAGGEYRCLLFFQDAHGAREEVVSYALYREDGKEGDDAIYLRQFFVTRGRRREGIGRAAMNLLLSEVWPADAPLRVDVLCHNKGAIAFWRHCGFEDYCLGLKREGGTRE